MKVFVTGFGPFLSVRENPSEILARRCGRPYHALEVTFDAVDAFLMNTFQRDAFDALLMIGVAAKSRQPRLERVGRNKVGATPDVSGSARPGPVCLGGSDELEATLWRRGDAKAAQMVYSNSAGDYLCNYALYQALRALPGHQVGFLHIPAFHQIEEAEQLARLHRLLERIEAR